MSARFASSRWSMAQVKLPGANSVGTGSREPHARGNALEVPDMRHRRRQLDVTHALAAHLGAGHLDAALVADDSLVPIPLVLAAVAFPVLGRTENLLAEQTVAFRLQRP